MRDTFEYSPAFYNDAILFLEEKWNRRLTEHEKHVLIEGYRYGRLQEMYSYYSGEAIERMKEGMR
jgi:hypothetical protein